MNPRSLLRRFAPSWPALLACLITVNPLALRAAVTKADNTNALGQASSWVGGTAPTSTDIATWSGTYSADATTNSLKAVMSGTALSWQGISVGTLSGTALTTNTIYAAVANLSAATESGSIVTFTTKANHGFAPSQAVTIAGVTPAGYNGTFAVLVVPVATNPTNLTAIVHGSNLVLSWPADHTGWQLQAQTNRLAVGISANWTPVDGSTSVNTMTFPIDPSQDAVFFRLALP